MCASRALAVSAALHHNNSSLIHDTCRNVQYSVYIYCQGDILSVQMRYVDELLLILLVSILVASAQRLRKHCGSVGVTV